MSLFKEKFGVDKGGDIYHIPKKHIDIHNDPAEKKTNTSIGKSIVRAGKKKEVAEKMKHREHLTSLQKKHGYSKEGTERYKKWFNMK